jgi:hypothetical protein
MLYIYIPVLFYGIFWVNCDLINEYSMMNQYEWLHAIKTAVYQLAIMHDHSTRVFMGHYFGLQRS